jgi:hypothetical protein
MRFFLLSLASLSSVLTLCGADDAWEKVRSLKTGQELRIFKKGSAQPVLAQMADLTGESLVVILKKEQTAIPKADIERIDARPLQTGSNFKRETKTTSGKGTTGAPNSTNTMAERMSPPSGNSGSSSSTSTTWSSSGKSDFETVYRRQQSPAPPKP